MCTQKLSLLKRANFQDNRDFICTELLDFAPSMFSQKLVLFLCSIAVPSEAGRGVPPMIYLALPPKINSLPVFCVTGAVIMCQNVKSRSWLPPTPSKTLSASES